jgi:cellulose synthase operon protein YhjQ
MTDPKSISDQGEASTPEDVATLYSWANLHGAKYRDFSSSRAVAREEARLRAEAAEAAERLRLQEEAERRAQEEAQIAARLAAEAAEAARQAEAERIAEIARQAELEREAVLAAQEAQRQAALQRSWEPAAVDTPVESYRGDYAPQGDYAPAFQGSPLPGASEPAGAYGSQFGGSEGAYPVLRPFGSSAVEQNVDAGVAKAIPAANPEIALPSRPPAPSANVVPDPYPEPHHPAALNAAAPVSAALPQVATRPYQPGRWTGPDSVPNSAGNFAANSVPDAGPDRVPYRDYPPAPTAPSQYAAPEYATPEYATPEYAAAPYPPARQEKFSSSPWSIPEVREPQELASRPAWLAPEIAELNAPPLIRQSVQRAEPPMYASVPASYVPPVQHAPVVPSAPSSYQPPVQAPLQPYAQQFSQLPIAAQVYGQQYASTPVAAQPPAYIPPPAQAPAEDTLAGSRDRIASRWFALKGVFDPQAAPVEQAPQQPPARVPVLAVFSLAGGVGKTSLVASLGRALSSRGERVLLVDTAAFGLLPFFFGARDQRPGMLRTFNPPGVSADAPIQLLTLDPDGQAPDAQMQTPQNPAQNQDWLPQEVLRYSRGVHRILVDLPTASGATTRRVLRMDPVVIVPVAPDMNSVVSVSAIESFFRNTGQATGGKQILPYYVLNQFDYSLPLHLDVREILREQIGDRLLPFALRRSPAVSEALAEGMTVMDYAPNANVAEDYLHLAEWVRSLSAPATQTYRGVRWSER